MHTPTKYAGWLQSLYGLHTFRVESIAHGKAAPVDELQVQGVSNPGLLRKVLVVCLAHVKPVQLKNSLLYMTIS